jgi:predicted transcriptional regulator
MSEVVVRLRPDIYEQLQKRAAAQEREPADVIAEAVEHWLEEDVEARIQRALERRGMLAQPPRRPRDPEVLEQDRQRVRQILAKLSPPLSEDIIQEREQSW